MFAAAMALCIFLCGCGAQVQIQPQSKEQSSVAAQGNVLKKVALGITPEQLLKVLESEGVKIKFPDYTEAPIPDDVQSAPMDGRIYNMADLSFYYETKDYRLFFSFDEYEKLTSISCRDEKIVTPKGLQVGDSASKAKAVYGNCIEQDDNRITFKAPDGYFFVFIQEDIVTHWLYSA